MIFVTLNTGSKFEGYTERLYSALKRNTTHPFDFDCLTESRYPGAWGKMDVFKKYAGCRYVYIDVDTVITGNVDWLFDYQGDFAIARNWYTGRYAGGLIGVGGFSGPFSPITEIQKAFCQFPKMLIDYYKLDQDWFYDFTDKADYWQDIAPEGAIKSFKYHAIGPDLPAGTSMVMFHGEVLPHHVTHLSWIREHWR